MITDREITRLSYFAGFLVSLPAEEVEKRCEDSITKEMMERSSADVKGIALAMICLASGKEYSGSGYYKEKAESILSGAKDNHVTMQKVEDAMFAEAKRTVEAIESRRRGRGQ